MDLPEVKLDKRIEISEDQAESAAEETAVRIAISRAGKLAARAMFRQHAVIAVRLRGGGPQFHAGFPCGT